MDSRLAARNGFRLAASSFEGRYQRVDPAGERECQRHGRDLLSRACSLTWAGLLPSPTRVDITWITGYNKSRNAGVRVVDRLIEDVCTRH